MNRLQLFRSVAAGALLVLVPVASAANAQTVTAATCVGGPRQLTKQENSLVNDFEILVARANSRHTPAPDPSPDIAALIACTSGGGVASTPSTASSTAAPAASSSSSSTAASGACAGGPRQLTRQENSLVNDYEILVARANSHHTPVPAPSPDIAALIACTSGGGVASTASTVSSTSSSSSSSSGTAASGACVGGPRTLTKHENSIVNDYEILVARANSHHTPVPAPSPDVAALIACL